MNLSLSFSEAYGHSTSIVIVFHCLLDSTQGVGEINWHGYFFCITIMSPVFHRYITFQIIFIKNMQGGKVAFGGQR
jgi:hypothetical protein